MSDLKKRPKCGKSLGAATKDSVKALKGLIYYPHYKAELQVFRMM